MTARTFRITVEDEEAGSQPMTEQATIDYIIFRLEAQSVLRVTMIESEEK